MQSSISSLGIVFADPLIQSSAPEVPERLELLIAYRTSTGTPLMERALFVSAMGLQPEVWLAGSEDLTSVLMLTDSDGKLLPAGRQLLIERDDVECGPVLRASTIGIRPGVYQDIVRFVLVSRLSKEMPGDPILDGLLDADAYAAVAGEMYSQDMLAHRLESGFLAMTDDRDPNVTYQPQVALPDRPEPVAMPGQGHALGVNFDGVTICAHCRKPAPPDGIRDFLLEPCDWKQYLADRCAEQRRDQFNPSLMSMLRGGVRPQGAELLRLLRLWFEEAPFSTSQCMAPDERCQYLKWAIGGRAREVLAMLDASSVTTDSRIAALIREMASWRRITGSAGLGSAISSANWGWLGRELGNPGWRD
jgi:hypothetical protein